HVLLTDPDTCFTSMDPDISDFNWIKHPLLKSSYLAKHTIDLVLDSWTDTFSYKADREGDPGLRNPQIGALHALQAHWSVSNEPAIVVLPTGTGKTETML